MACIVAAYTSSPCQTEWNETAEAAFYDGLLAIPGLDGLEIPFTGTLHPHDEGWLLRRLPAAGQHVITCLPGTMARLAATPAFGLASTDDAGRSAAVGFAHGAAAAVARVNQAAGRAAVLAVALHSAPGQARATGSAAALASSLAQLAAVDWQGAALVIEHCDAPVPSHPSEKGFLALEEELAALAGVSAPVRLGLAVNWARSVLESRDALTGAAHVAAIAAAGRLEGIMFSGCSADPDQPWGAWRDTHMPHAPASGIATGMPSSLLTEAVIAATLAAGRPRYVGAKIGAQPPDMPLALRVGLNRDLIALVRRNLT